MLLKTEFKKLFIKQYGLILTLIVFIIKLATSGFLYETSYSHLDHFQQEYYLQYMEQYGGRITDDKEQEILSLYGEVQSAKALQTQIMEKRTRGEYETPEEFMQAMSEVPDIIEKYDAIALLYENCKRVSRDKENLLMLPSDANGMTVGAEYLLIILICYLSAMTCYYERKTVPLTKTAAKGRRSAFYRLTALFSLIFLCWLAFLITEFVSVISILGAENMLCGIGSLSAFEHTLYPSLDIAGGFALIQFTKLIGYLLLASVCIILCTLTKNLPLSLFAPLAAVCVWIYLFSPNNVTYYSPFSLVLGSPYFTGDYYITVGNLVMLQYNSIPTTVFILLILIAIALIITAVMIYQGSVKAFRIKNKATVTVALSMFILLMSGCSYNEQDGQEVVSSRLCTDGINYYNLVTETDKQSSPTGYKIQMYDSDLNIIHDDILREVFHDEDINDMLCFDGYLYYWGQKKGAMPHYIHRIDLKTFRKELVYTSNDSNNVSKYLDTLTIWNDGLTDTGTIRKMFTCGGKLCILTEEYGVYSIDVATGVRTLLFKESYMNDICVAKGKIFYINSDGNPASFDGEKTVMSDRIFFGICSDGEYVYCTNDNMTYRYNADNLSEEKFLDTGDIFSVYDGNAISSDGVFITKDGKQTDFQYKDTVWFLNGKLICHSRDGVFFFSFDKEY